MNELYEPCLTVHFFIYLGTTRILNHKWYGDSIWIILYVYHLIIVVTYVWGNEVIISLIVLTYNLYDNWQCNHTYCKICETCMN